MLPPIIHWKAMIPARSEIHMIPDVNLTPSHALTLTSLMIRGTAESVWLEYPESCHRRGRGFHSASAARTH